MRFASDFEAAFCCCGNPEFKAIGSDVPWGMPVANRLCPDENLLRQNASI